MTNMTDSEILKEAILILRDKKRINKVKGLLRKMGLLRVVPILYEGSTNSLHNNNYNIHSL